MAKLKKTIYKGPQEGLYMLDTFKNFVESKFVKAELISTQNKFNAQVFNIWSLPTNILYVGLGYIYSNNKKQEVLVEVQGIEELAKAEKLNNELNRIERIILKEARRIVLETQ